MLNLLLYGSPKELVELPVEARTGDVWTLQVETMGTEQVLPFLRAMRKERDDGTTSWTPLGFMSLVLDASVPSVWWLVLRLLAGLPPSLQAMDE